MFTFDRWQEILTTLRRHKLRTALTSFGVFWGILMLIVLLGVGRGLENGVYANFENIATNSFFMWGGKTSRPYKGLNPGRYIDLTNADIAAIRENIPGIRYLNASMVLFGEFAVSYQEHSGSFTVKGDWPDLYHVEPFQMLHGRFLNPTDMKQGRKVAVIGRRVQEVLFGDRDPIGQHILIKNVAFQVVGVFNLRRISSQGRDPTELIHIPLPTLQQAFDYGPYVGWFGVSVADQVAASTVEAQVKAFLKARYQIAPEDERGIGSWNMEEDFQKVQSLFCGLTFFIWLVGAGTILAGIVGVSNIMLIIVQERTREIGVRKALGATPFSIISSILHESVFITAFSGYVGLVAGVVVLEIISYVMDRFALQSIIFRNPEIDFQMAITATLLLILSGALAGFIPARNAVNINPIEALRSA